MAEKENEHKKYDLLLEHRTPTITVCHFLSRITLKGLWASAQMVKKVKQKENRANIIAKIVSIVCKDGEKKKDNLTKRRQTNATH